MSIPVANNMWHSPCLLFLFAVVAQATDPRALLQSPPCPARTEIYQDPGDGQVRCRFCAYNQVSTGPNTACAPCGPGTYARDNLQCLPCPRGTYSEGGDVLCLVCPVGFVSETAQSAACSPCQAWQRAIGTSACLDCPPGHYGTSAGICEPCGPGTYLDRATWLCNPCAAGTASSLFGSDASCPLCQPGFYASVPGAAQCKPCPVNTIAPANGTVICTDCPENEKTAEDGSTVCVDDSILTREQQCPAPSSALLAMYAALVALLLALPCYFGMLAQRGVRGKG